MENKILDQFIKYRASRNLTQQDMAEQLGFDRGVIIRFEQGKSISRINYFKILMLIEDDLKSRKVGK